MRYYEILEKHNNDLALSETASAGSSSAGGIATVIGGLGAGFDPNGEWRSIYSKKNQNKKKAMLIKRINSSK